MIRLSEANKHNFADRLVIAAALRVAVEAVERISNFDCANDNWKACATSCPSCIAGAARARIAETVEVGP